MVLAKTVKTPFDPHCIPTTPTFSKKGVRCKLEPIWPNFGVVPTNFGNIGVVGILWESNGVF
jgi:hypothetical protein